MIPPLTLDRFYQLVREAVMVYPLTDMCHRPKTFAVIDHIAEINLTDLGKSFVDYDKRFFYSERFRDTGMQSNSVIYDFPIVTATFVGGLVGVVSDNNKSLYSTIHLASYDTLKNSGKNRNCESRVHHEVERDCITTLSNILGYLNTVQVAEYEGNVDYFSINFLEYYKAKENKNYKVIAKPKFFSTEEEAYYLSTVETGIEHTYGAVLKLRVKLGLCGDNSYNFTYAEPYVKLDSCCG